MKFFIFLFFYFSATFSFGQKKKLDLNKYFKIFYKANIYQFKGFRFVCDSLAKNKELGTLCLELFSNSALDTVSISPDSIITYLGNYIPQTSINEFEQLPLYDPKVRFTQKEEESNLELFKLDKKWREGKVNRDRYYSQFDSITHSISYTSYRTKLVLSQKRLLIFYQPVLYKNKLLIACRIYVNGRISDSGEMFYKVFSLSSIVKQ